MPPRMRHSSAPDVCHFVNDIYMPDHTFDRSTPRYLISLLASSPMTLAMLITMNCKIYGRFTRTLTSPRRLINCRSQTNHWHMFLRSWSRTHSPHLHCHRVGLCPCCLAIKLSSRSQCHPSFQSLTFLLSRVTRHLLGSILAIQPQLGTQALRSSLMVLPGLGRLPQRA